MAYETTYSGLLQDQEDLISKYIQMQDELGSENEYSVDNNIEDIDDKDITDEVPEDYEFLKNYFDENEAKASIDEDENDLSFLNFIFEGNNKYQSFSNNNFNYKNQNFNSAENSGIKINNETFKDTISRRESGGNYKAISPNSSARGKYQFIWSIHKDKIAQQTGVKSQQEFLNNPQAQEQYFDYWDQTTLTPSANANYEKFKSYYPNATVEDVKSATHFAGRAGLEKALRTGNLSQPLDANNTSIQKYVFRR